MSIYGNSVGGGGIVLNFDVVDGTTAPDNPSENTIWVNTDTPITGWFFSSQDPATNYDTKYLLASATMASGLLKDGAVDTSYDASYTEDFIPIKDGKVYTYSFSAQYENVSTGDSISIATPTMMIITEYCMGNDADESYTYYNDVVVVDTSVSGQTVPTYKTFSGTYTPSSSQVKAVRISSTNNYYYASSASVPLKFIEKNDMSWVDDIVWIVTGTNSSIDFNATKNKSKNIEIYPTICKQYISGEWVVKDAQIYQDGNWANINQLIYDNGTVYVNQTTYLVPSTSTVEFGETSINLATVANKTSEVYAVFGPVSLDDVNTLSMTGMFTDSVSGSHRYVLYVAETSNVGYADAVLIASESLSSNWTSETTITLDVAALEGEYYIYAGQNTNGSAWQSKRSLSITNVAIER